uniref:Uncharacterized protein n=1 Tax=Aegilops tauschii subsp. strangulata TaxID=200361 RepID=A0A453ID01_AEGTS
MTLWFSCVHQHCQFWRQMTKHERLGFFFYK